MRLTLLVAALALLAGPALALDCAKARTPVEKMICADKAVLALDGRMSGLYRRALDEGQEPETLRNTQRAWLADRDRCTDRACVEARYRARVARLDDYLAALNADDRRDVDFIPVADGPRRCLRYVPSTAPNVAVACRVAAFRPLGVIGGMRRVYALYEIAYRWNGQDIAFAAPVVLTNNPADPTLLAFDFMITDAAGLAGAARGDVAPRHVNAADGDRLVFDLPAVNGGREVRTWRLDKGVWTATR